MRLFVDFSPKRRRNYLWTVFTVIIILLALTIAFLFNSIFKSNSIVLTVSGLILIVLIVFTYILGIIISNWQYVAEMSKNNFTNNIVHEIKTPITVISLACEMLQEKNLPENKSREEQINEYLPIIEAETEQLKKLVDVFLQHSRIDSSNFALNIEKIDLHELIGIVIDRADIIIKNKKGSISSDLKATKHYINGDKLQISNVLTNIIDNGIKYSEKPPQIAITTHDDPHGIVIRIADNGIGIPANETDHIFEKFYRVQTGDRHNVKGYGIGLNYALRIVQMHGGNIKVSSKPGKGSVFMVFLPV